MSRNHDWGSRLLRTLAIAALLSASFAVGTPARAVDISQSFRASLGLPADAATIQNIVASGMDVGTKELGVPLTPEELADLHGRMEYAYQVEESVAPYVRGLASFGGLYFDQLAGGRLVVLLTSLDTATAEETWSRMPAGPPVAFRTVAVPYSSLQSATERAFDVWAELSDLPAPYASEVVVQDNAIRVAVDKSILQPATALIGPLEMALRVPVEIVAGRPPEAQTCTDRDHCTNPIKGGVLVRKGSTTGSPCTMAFEVVHSGDIQFLTAGHCALSGSVYWYHKGYGYLGAVSQSLFYSGYDVVRVGFPDSQSTPWMYGDGHIIGWNWPYVGAVLYQSAGMSNFIRATQVLSDWSCWDWSGQHLCGAKMTGVGGVGGDSGSPLYQWAGTSQLLAVGINFGGDGSGNGLMTRVGDAVSRMSITLVTSPV